MRSTLPRVIPARQKRPSDVHTSGRSGAPLTTKKCVLLQVATNPCGSSIRASSAPAVYAWMQAVMSLSLLWALSFGSSVSGVARRTCVVNSGMPSRTVAGRGRHGLLLLGDDDDRRRADGHPRVLVRRRLHAPRHHQPHVHPVDHVV